MVAIRDNDFTFNLKGLSNPSFKLASHSITRGQPWEGVRFNNNTMRVRAGRKGSKDVATWFKNEIDSGLGIGLTYSDKLPKALNFAFSGNLEFMVNGVHYSAKNIVIAQGHNVRNNWWMGSKHLVGDKQNGWSSLMNKYAEDLVAAGIAGATENVVGLVEAPFKAISHLFGGGFNGGFGSMEIQGEGRSRIMFIEIGGVSSVNIVVV